MSLSAEAFGRIRFRVSELQRQLLQHQLDYAHGMSAVSDDQYDSMMIELKALEGAHPELCNENSPTQRVGAPIASGLDRVVVKHEHPMLSLDNIYTFAELLAKFPADMPINLEHKMDGVALSLHYAEGEFVRAVLRGDGEQGEDVTLNARTIRNLPILIPLSDPIEVRGEVVILRSSLAVVNEWRTRVGKKPYANCRNGVAGAMRSLDPADAAGALLHFYAYDLIEPLFGQMRQEDKLRLLRDYKFYTVYNVSANIAAAAVIYAEEMDLRSQLNFEIDGIVIKCGDYSDRLKYGEGTTAPKWAVAWKFAPKPVESTVTGIRVQIGRTGAVTPVVDIVPVECGGVTISKATLHNMDQIERLGGINVGAKVMVQRGGDVIPDIVSCEKAPGLSWAMPFTCPACNSILQKDGAVTYCTNTLSCKAQLVELIQHSAKAIKMLNIGPVQAAQLISEFDLKSLADFYALEGKDSSVKSGDQVYVSKIRIGLPQFVPLHQFIECLGIRLIGESNSKKIAGEVRTVDGLLQASPLSLKCAIGTVAGNSLWYALHATGAEESVRKIAAKLAVVDAPARSGGPLSGLTIVVTGTLQAYTRSSIKEVIEKAGGKVAGSVSKKTDLLIVGTEPGSKLADAQKHNVRTITEFELAAMLS